MSRQVSDHEGNVFPNVRIMCEHWNIPYHNFYSRAKTHGWSLKDALTTPVSQYRHVCTDHLNNKFASARDMCRHWKIPYRRFRSRVCLYGWSLEQALTAPLSQHSPACTDHLGNRFDTAIQRADHYGLEPVVIRSRLCRGWSLERALTTPVTPRGIIAQDHLGRKYSSISDMARAWHKKPLLVFGRLNSGWTVKRALTV